VNDSIIDIQFLTILVILYRNNLLVNLWTRQIHYWKTIIKYKLKPKLLCWLLDSCLINLKLCSWYLGPKLI
jgi:hypothetical protein